MAARSTQVTLDNTTPFNLLLTERALDHGEWTTEPPTIIGNFGLWRSESNGVLTGTEGSASYSIRDLDDVEHGLVHVHWDNPFAGSNSYTESVTPGGAQPDGFSIFHLGGSGNDANVTFKLFRGNCTIRQDTGEIACSQGSPLQASGVQSAWRFCGKCHGMFFNGFSSAGVCPAGGAHAAAGITFLLLHDVPVTPGYKAGFRFCDKCFALHRPGTGLGSAPGDPGVCPQGGGHHAAGFTFVLPLSHPGHGQDLWTRCGKCRSVYWDAEADKGRCAAGGAHVRAVTLTGQPDDSLQPDFLPA